MPMPNNLTSVIFVTKNGDTFSEPVKIVVNLLYNYVTQRLNLANATRYLYNIDGRVVNSIDELVAGKLYVVCCGHETFKPADYSIRRSKTDLQSKRTSLRQRNSFISSKPTLSISSKETSFFTPHKKAYKVIVFRNGDEKHPGNVLYLNYRNCRTWDQFMEEVSSAVPNRTVGIRAVYNAETAQQIRTWDHLFDGINLVAAGSEAFQHKNYGILTKDVVDKDHHVRRTNVYYDYSHRPSDGEKPRLITVFPNGDAYHMGFNVSVSNVKYPYLEKLLDYINDHVKWNSMAAGKRLYRLPDGYRIQFVTELVQHGQYVVGTDTEPFMNMKYNIKAWVPLNKIAKIPNDSGKEDYNPPFANVQKRKPKQSKFLALAPTLERSESSDSSVDAAPPAMQKLEGEKGFPKVNKNAIGTLDKVQPKKVNMISMVPMSEPRAPIVRVKTPRRQFLDFNPEDEDDDVPHEVDDMEEYSKIDTFVPQQERISLYERPPNNITLDHPEEREDKNNLAQKEEEIMEELEVRNVVVNAIKKEDVKREIPEVIKKEVIQPKKEEIKNEPVKKEEAKREIPQQIKKEEIKKEEREIPKEIKKEEIKREIPKEEIKREITQETSKEIPKQIKEESPKQNKREVVLNEETVHKESEKKETVKHEESPENIPLPDSQELYSQKGSNNSINKLKEGQNPPEVISNQNRLE